LSAPNGGFGGIARPTATFGFPTRCSSRFYGNRMRINR
jgi:hypothetical protein